MERVYIYGAGGSGRRLAAQLKDEFDIIGFIESDENKHGNAIDGLPCVGLEEALNKEFDKIILGSMAGLYEMKENLLIKGIAESKIISSYVSSSVLQRLIFLHRYAEIVSEKSMQGSVAEAGVYRGEFAKEINQSFPQKRCYLFDTFDGFDDRDFKYENIGSDAFEKHFNNTSVDLVMSKMPYPQQVVIRKGYVPESLNGIDDQFCFVNLDMDLYKPTFDALRFFYPKMVNGGVILIHDYYSLSYPNIKLAIDDFEKEIGGIRRFPIGDELSIAIMK